MNGARIHPVASPTSWAVALARHQDMDHGDATRIMNLLRTAFESLKSGHGTDQDFDRLAAALNVGMIRAESIDPVAAEYMLQAAQGLIEADRINEEHGHYGFTGPGLAAVGVGLDLYEEILRKSTPRQMGDAAEESARRIRAGLVAGA